MPIYKDEDIYTFDSPESPGGIDVCLTCFYATSPDVSHNFTEMHYRTTGHSVFVNIVKTPKLRERPKQLKLAIDKETDEDLYETKTFVKDLSGSPVDQASYADAVAKVLSAESYSKAQEIEAWELEITPCEHILLLQQPHTEGKLSSEQLSKCSQCELTSNLWICLSCGTVSCGRPQFGGGGGNGHALVHFSDSQHSLAVKLGSITPEGSADVFCYADDNDVKDPELAAHLQHWGIDIATRSKTEKSMTELQLEQNAKWDFSMESDGKALEPVFGPGFTGLRNLGNTCYLNSVMQTLMAVPQFREMFPANTIENVADFPDAPNNLVVQLRKLRDGLYSGRYSRSDPHSDGGHQRGISPGMLKFLLGKGHSEFSTMRQQDAYEFLSHFLTKLSEATKASGFDDLSEQLFGFETQQRMQCQVCNAVRYVSHKEESLSIPVPIVADESESSGYKPVSFSQLLGVLTDPEEIEFLCTSCKEKREVTSTVSFGSFPEILVVNARRFEIVNWVPRKVDVPVQVPPQINLDSYFGAGPVEGETLMPEDTEKVEFVPNETHLASLLSMGFSAEDASQALQVTGNLGVDPAMEFLFMPPEEKEAKLASAGQKSATTSSARPEDIEALEAMGFTAKQAKVALKKNHSVESAVDWLFSGNAETAESGPDPDSEDAGPASEPQPRGSRKLPADYRLRGIISHKGGSIHAGHYVAFIRGDDEQWYLCNDEKVVKGADAQEMQQYAYLYIFERT